MTFFSSNVRRGSDRFDLVVKRRGFDYGGIQIVKPEPLKQDGKRNWSDALFLPGFLKNEVFLNQNNFQPTREIVRQALESDDVSDLFETPYHQKRLKNRFEWISSVYNEGDDQEVVKYEFDAIRDGQVVAENLWCKLAWLSLHDEDPSLRFRFSFGLEDIDAARDGLTAKLAAAELAEALFAESALVSQNDSLKNLLCGLLNSTDLSYVERIFYFNAPEGGALFHHDVERGHAGVVYAQVTGQTLWLALPKPVLRREVCEFYSLPADSDDETVLSEERLNQNLEFFQVLIERGYGYYLEPGDVLLLPQMSLDDCVWHSVFGVGDEMGEGLSFAVVAFE